MSPMEKILSSDPIDEVGVDTVDLNTLLDGLGEGVVVTDLDSIILYANKHMAEMLGYSVEELLGRRGYELFLPPDQWSDILGKNRNRQQGLSEEYELELTHSDGMKFWVHINATPRYDKDGEVIGTLSVFADVDDRKRRELELEVILKCVTAPSGQCLFDQVTRTLAIAFGAKMAFITECTGPEVSRVRTIACWLDGQPEACREYDLKDTVCETVVGRSHAYYAKNLCAIFPLDRHIAQYKMESYVGVPFYSPDGKPTGHLALMHDRPLREKGRILEVLRVVGERVSGEIERNRKEAELVHRNLLLKKERHAREIADQTSQVLREELRSVTTCTPVGRDPLLLEVLETVKLVADTDCTVLIQGATGTGKELMARLIQEHSRRAHKPLIKVNCPALPLDIIESELFGHEKGAFTGAQQQRMGRFELADGGTLFLDEIGELGTQAQAKLLRVIQEREFERVGGSESIKVDVRLIAATNRDLAALVRQGKFREDLFFRLNVFPLKLPPLCGRPGDIELLAHHFLGKFSRELGKVFEGIETQSLAAMRAYDWPGNVRELENIVHRAAILSPGPLLVIRDLIVEAPDRESVPHPDDLDIMIKNHLRDVLQRSGWVIEGPKGAAAVLGINPSTLRSKLKKFGIEKPE